MASSRDSELIEFLRSRDGRLTRVVLDDGRDLAVMNIAWGYDDSEEWAHVTTNISPPFEGLTADIFSTAAVTRVVDPLTGLSYLPRTREIADSMPGDLSSADLDLYEELWERVAGRDEGELSTEERAYYHAEHVNMEALNGGLVQYFMNTRGDEIADARTALRVIGAQYHAEIFERAVAIWNQERALPDSWWTDELDDRAFGESRIAELDDEWYARDIIPIELGYARANAASFGLSA